MQRWPETKRLLGLLVNSSGAAHARNAQTARARLAQAGPPPRRRAARRRAGAHAGGRGGPARSAHADGAQAVRARARAAQELPEGPATARWGAPPEEPRPRPRFRRRVPAAGRGAGGQRRRSNQPRSSLEAGRTGIRAATRRRSAQRPDRGAPRCTSPASSSTRPSAVSTSSAPRASMPAAVPLPPSHVTELPSSTSRSRHAASARSGSWSRRFSSERSRRGSSVGDRRSRLGSGRDRQRGGRVAELRRQLVGRGGHVDPDPHHRPALLRPALDEDAGDLPPLEPDVVRPLDAAAHRRRGLARIADRDRRGQRQQDVVLVERPDHHRGKQRSARRRLPASTLPPAPRGLGARRDQGAVGAPRSPSVLARSLVESTTR